MNTKMVSVLKGFGVSMITGALLFAAYGPDSHHRGQPVTVAAVDPHIFHHWPDGPVSVADLDPKIFHHWPDQTISIADLNPAIFHHWA